MFAEHAISSGRVLLEVQQSHLHEIGVARVGHRLEMWKRLQELKEKAGLVCPMDFTSLQQK